MSSPTKRLAADTHSRRTRNETSTTQRRTSESALGMRARGRKSGEDRKSPSGLAAKRG